MAPMGVSRRRYDPHAYRMQPYLIHSWPAPEVGTLEGTVRTAQPTEDLWGFGLCLYELYTKAMLPYGNNTWLDEAAYLETMYEVWQQCLPHVPNLRRPPGETCSQRPMAAQ